MKKPKIEPSIAPRENREDYHKLWKQFVTALDAELGEFLFEFARQGNAEDMKKLIPVVDIDMPNREGKTALATIFELLCNSPNKRKVKFLVNCARLLVAYGGSVSCKQRIKF